MRFAAQRPITRQPSPPRQAAKPRRTGYEGYIPQLEADASIWGLPSKPTPEPAPHQIQASQGVPGGARRILSLEEVEAEMARQDALAAQQASESAQLPGFNFPQQPPHPQNQYAQPQQPGMQPLHILQRRPQPTQELPGSQPKQPELPEYGAHQPQILQRPRQESVPPRGPQIPQAQQGPHGSPEPRQILQNPNRLSGQGQPLVRSPPTGPSHQRGSSYNGPLITNPQQILNLSENDRAAFLQDEARRAKRNHKIHMLSKNNGLMTPQDKNFITRIQLQQLVTAIGSLDAQNIESQLNEDFYYQVYAQIRAATRRDPHQPASQFAHTYLFQTGGRYGLRRGVRHGDSHLARMEQQVARAVEAAKAKPKNKQLVIEGSLGKISYSNAKTPKPLLNFVRPETEKTKITKKGNDPAAERRTILKDIENVYIDLMKLEDHERQVPPRLEPDSDPNTIQRHMEWRDKLTSLNGKLWNDLKIMEAIDQK
jgi:DNA topoisomerase 2-associated protein PAT1